MIARLQAENTALRATAHLESIADRLKEQVEKLEPPQPEEGRGNPFSRRLQRLASAAIDLPLDIKDDDLSIDDLALLCTVLEDENCSNGPLDLLDVDFHLPAPPQYQQRYQSPVACRQKCLSLRIFFPLSTPRISPSTSSTLSPTFSSNIKTFSQYQQKQAETASRHPSDVGESQRDLPYGNKVGLPRSNGRGDQYGGGHGQVPLPPPQAPGNAMNLSWIVHSLNMYLKLLPPPLSADRHTGLIYSPLNDCGTPMAVLNSITYAPSRLKLRC
ncbi:hypothetical protein Ddc_23803 [Ditylenchus destructor]|nr:hypothetical protein Ddc_23803 [Ditylenchus destructor]